MDREGWTAEERILGQELNDSIRQERAEEQRIERAKIDRRRGGGGGETRTEGKKEGQKGRD